MPDFPTLARAIDDTIDASLLTSDRVLATFDALAAGVAPHADGLEARLAESGRLQGHLAARLERARAAITSAATHAAERRKGLNEFRVAMFGRTGVGKSSLIEALTHGDGASISPGRGDHTEDVREVRWGPLLVVDMPGLLGAGRRLTREQLEARAEAEVKRADLVLLAFDSQNQQVAEFERAAQMVLRYRKPVLVVLNIRNPNWRSPDPAITGPQRRKRDLAVQQQFAHVDHELSRIGVHGCPIVAISTLLATFARCDPYRAPRFGEVRDRQVAAYGIELLEEASNIRALEELVVRVITESCGALREAGLVGDLEAGMVEVQGHLTGLLDAEQAEAVSARILRDVGYPREVDSGSEALNAPPLPADNFVESLGEAASGLTSFEIAAIRVASAASVRASDGVIRAATVTSAGDELAELEGLRGRPFDAPRVGKLHKRLEQRMTIAFRVARLEARRRAEDAVLNAGRKAELNIADDVLRADEQEAVAAEVVSTAIEDACALLERTSQQVSAAFQIKRAAMTVRSGGDAERVGMFASRLGSVGTGAALVVATTNFWNPGGWMAFGLVAGGFVASLLGSRFSKKAEKRRLEARAASLAEARGLVDEGFDALERDVRRTFWAAVTTIVASLIVTPLRDAADLRLVERLAAGVEGLECPRASSVAKPVDLVPRGVLLGERWAPDDAGDRPRPVEPMLDPALFESLAWSPIASAVELDGGSLEHAHARLQVLLEDEELAEVRLRVERVLKHRMKVVIAGDYSSAKSSLRAVLTRTTRASRRRIRRGADRTTTEVERGRLGRLELLDTPGLGSRDPNDAETAERAIEDASLVLYLVTPRLIADLPSPLLDQLSAPGLQGSIARARTRFALTRIDELGASPSDAPGEFVGAVQGKREELARILRRRGIETSVDDVLALAPDPLGSDFDDAVLAHSAPWSGLAQVRTELAALSMASDDRRIAALSAAMCELARIRDEVLSDVTVKDRDVESRKGLQRSTVTADEETRSLGTSLRASLHAAIAPVVGEIIDHVLRTSGDQQKAAVDRAQSWTTDPRIEQAIDRWQVTAATAVREHAEAVSSELQRQFEGSFGTAGTGAVPRLDADVRVASGGPRRAATTASQAAASVRGITNTRVIAMRDALRKLPIPAERLKFKPWGATKLAKKAKLAGKAAAVLGLALEVATIYLDHKAKAQRESLRRTVRDGVNKAVDGSVDDIMLGSEDEPGIDLFLSDLSAELATVATSLSAEIDDLEVETNRARVRIERIDNFLMEVGG